MEGYRYVLLRKKIILCICISKEIDNKGGIIQEGKIVGGCARRTNETEKKKSKNRAIKRKGSREMVYR